MVKKIFALFLAMLMLFGTACASATVSEESKTKKTNPIYQAPPEEPPLPDGNEIDDSAAEYWVPMVSKGEAQFTVVSAGVDYDELAASFARSLSQTTGVTFLAKTSAESASASGAKIVVGRNVNAILADPSSLTYLGALSLDNTNAKQLEAGASISGTIYLSGHELGSVQHATMRFLEGFLPRYRTTDAEGKIEVKIPDFRIFFLYNPIYAFASPKLLGEDLKNYTIITPSTVNAAEKLMIRSLLSQIGSDTGLLLPVKTDSARQTEHEIVIGETNRPHSQALYAALGGEDFALQSAGKSLYVAYDNYLVMDDARETLHELYRDEASASQTSVAIIKSPSYTAHGMIKEASSHVRVMTSNIICPADSWVAEWEREEGVTWQDRVGLQGVMMMDYLPDFVGLQEIQEGVTNGIRATMRTELLKTVGEEYSVVEYDGMMDNNTYWNPILYRHTVWQIEEIDSMYSENFDNDMHRWQWALFSRISNPEEKYILINLHYPAGRDHAPRMNAAELVNAEIVRLRNAFSGVPIFVTGDFNCTVGTDPFSATIQNTTIETANYANGAIDHVLYDSALVSAQRAMFINNGWIAKSSDHRPFFLDVAPSAA